jgi:hypothetical protein
MSSSRHRTASRGPSNGSQEEHSLWAEIKPMLQECLHLTDKAMKIDKEVERQKTELAAMEAAGEGTSV